MTPRTTPSPFPHAQCGPPATGDRRVADRTPVSQISCDAGLIVDISVRGMRVLAHGAWREGESRALTLTDGRHSLALAARCIWSRRDANSAYSIGLSFDQVEPEQEGMLLRFTMEHGGNG